MQKQLSEFSRVELEKKQSSHKLAVSMLGGMLIVMLGVSIYLTVMEGFNVFTVLPVAFFPVFLAMLSNLKKISKELEIRK